MESTTRREYSMYKFIFVTSLFFTFNCYCQDKDSNDFNWKDSKVDMYSIEINKLNFPEWVYKVILKEKLNSNYDLSIKINPFLLYGDFNGDGELDIAFWVQKRDSKNLGIMIMNSNEEKIYVIGADNKFSEKNSTLNLFTNWELVSRKSDIYDLRKHLNIKGDALLIIKLESSSGVIFWEGNKYIWKWLGD